MITRTTLSLPDLDWEDVERISRARGEPAWVLGLRQKAFRLYQESPAPSRTAGTIPLDLPGAPGERDARLKGAVLPPGSYLVDLPTAVRTLPDLVRPYLFHSALHLDEASAEGGRELAVQAFLWNEGLFVYLPAGARASRPLVTLVRVPAAAGRLRPLVRHLLVVLEPGAELELIEDRRGNGRTGEGASTVISTSWEVVLKEGARLRLSLIQDLPPHAHASGLGRVKLEKDASFELFLAEVGGASSTLYFGADLAGTGAEARTSGLFVGHASQRFQLDLENVHRAEHTMSDLLLRGVLGDRASAIVRGLGRIRFGAREATSNQRTDTLLLSPGARADTIPSLKIDEDDVHAGHGAAVGQIDEEALFYLMSRGLARPVATRLLVEGFLEALLTKSPNGRMEKRLRHLIWRKIEQIGGKPSDDNDE